MASSARSVLSVMEGDRDISLVDLDKGLRSAKKGEQIEAVVSFPTLFDKNPFPIMVNSGCLKLADAFDTGDNFTRVNILTVLEQSRRHLDKVLNVDEFLIRIYKVIHSNDPVARAITLRTLGACACILKDKADVHHSIVNALDSHDQIEVEAAIDAAIKFSEQSPNFIMNALPKVAAKIHSASVPMKIRFIPILQYVYSSEDATAKVRELCNELLHTHPALDIVLPVLHTLTRLSTHALCDIPVQLDLLLDVLQSDSRRRVRAAALHHLASLVSLAPHAVTTTHAQMLLSFVFATSDDTLQAAALDMLCSLAGSCAAAVFAEVQGVSRLQDYFFHPDAKVSAKAVELLSELVASTASHQGESGCNSEAGGVSSCLCEIDQLAYAVESLIVLAGAENRRAVLKVALRSAVLLSRVTAIDIVMETCIQAMQCMSDDMKVMVCLFLYQMLPRGLAVVSECAPGLIAGCARCLSEGNRDNLMVALWMLILKASSAAHPSCNMSTLLVQTGTVPAEADRGGSSDSCVAGRAGWTAYRIARQAMRHGHSRVAVHLLQHLLPQVSSEVNYFFLHSLLALCQASPSGSCDDDGTNTLSSSLEDSPCLNSGLIPPDELSRRIRWCEKAYLSARALSSHSAFMAASSTSVFHQKYVAIYLEVLQAHNQLHLVCSSFKDYPPPAAAAPPSRQHGCSAGVLHILPQLKKCESEFKALSESYGKLRQSMFDADSGSLSHIQWLHDSCSLVAYCLHITIRKGATAGSGSPVLASGGVLASPVILAAEHSELRSFWDAFLVSSHAFTAGGDSSGNTASDAIEALRKLSTSIINVPLKIPRYIFQRLQLTRLSINIQPAQKAANDPLLVHADTLLVLKVEGVVSCHTKLPKPLRRVSQMQVTVCCRLANQTQGTSMSSALPQSDLYGNVKGAETGSESTMMQTAALLNDYFSVQFLLSFPHVGNHGVQIGCVAIDEDGVSWIISSATGSSEAASVSVKSYRDQTKQVHPKVSSQAA